MNYIMLPVSAKVGEEQDGKWKHSGRNPDTLPAIKFEQTEA